MSDADALLRAVLDAPGDDAPRLVYADWLDEHSDPARAAFIRAQVELARLAADDPARTRLVQTERTLLNANRTAWTDWLPTWVDDYEFRRGFIEYIRGDAASFVAEGDKFRRQTPLDGVRLDGQQQFAVAIFRSRALEGLRSLTLSVNVPPRTWDHLATSPYLGRLVDLDVTSTPHTDEMVRALVSSSALPDLRSLRLKWCALGDEHTARLVGHPWAARLRTLDLSNNHIGGEGARTIAGSPYLDGLDQLALMGNPLAENAVVAEALRTRFGSRLRL